MEQFVDKFAISGSNMRWNRGGGDDSGNLFLGFAREGGVMFQFLGSDRLDGVHDARVSSSKVIYHILYSS